MTRSLESISLSTIAADLSGLPPRHCARMLAGFLRGLAAEMRARGDPETAIAESINRVRAAIEAAIVTRGSGRAVTRMRES